MSRRSGRRSGVSLVEVVVASAVLAILLLGLFTAVGAAARNDTLMRETEVANRYAAQQLDEVVMSADSETAYDALLGADQGFHVPFETGRGTVNLAPARTNPNPGGMAGRLQVAAHADGNYTFNGKTFHLLQATARVRWRAADGTDQEVVLVCRKARP